MHSWLMRHPAQCFLLRPKGWRVENDRQIRMILQELMRLGMLSEFSQVSKLSNPWVLLGGLGNDPVL